MTKRNLDIYYAHHQWKYGTKIEEYELDLIRAYFPNAMIFNPSVALDIDGRTEDEIMDICLHQIDVSDMIIFSSVDGLVGIGVFKEITHAKDLGMPIYYINGDVLEYDFDMELNLLSTSDRTYGRISLC